ncbi:septum formation initiator family protein [Rhodospirillales bacterium]|jgi:cell division protein FtsB|nr:septum formation initiator family protein [Rhodospirillales bacterium]
MGLIEEIRRRAKHVVGPLFGIVAVSYFAYHTVHGDRGVLSLVQMRERVSDAERQLNRLVVEEDHWSARVKLLHPDSIDRDMLDERVRVMLGYARADDVIVLNLNKE